MNERIFITLKKGNVNLTQVCMKSIRFTTTENTRNSEVDENIVLKSICLVAAPVQDITIQYLENEIICSSDGIYPEPTLTWTPDQTNQKTRLTQTEQKLYSIRSSVPSADSMDVTCTVSTPAGSRRATLESTGGGFSKTNTSDVFVNAAHDLCMVLFFSP